MTLPKIPLRRLASIELDAEQWDLLVTSAAGKVALLGPQAMNTTGLADRLWSREATPERSEPCWAARFLVLHRERSACYFDAYLSPSTTSYPIASYLTTRVTM